MKISKEKFKHDFIEQLMARRAKSVKEASDWDKYATLGGLVRGYLARNWINTNVRYCNSDSKQVYYFSMEFLMGRLLENHLINLNMLDICKEGR
jgi:Glucan phosphorylase